MKIRISVITINLNNLIGLKRTFESVLNQNYPEVEYLLIDGKSTDGSKEYIKENQDKVHYWVSEKDFGVYYAMNKGISKATGDYLIFLNSGDYFSDPNSLTNLISNSEGEDLVYGNLVLREASSTRIKKYPAKLNFRYFYFESLPHPACLIAKSLFSQYGQYDTSLRIVSDWKFFLLVVVKYKCSYKFIDKKISTFSLDGLSSKRENFNQMISERVFTLKKYFYVYFVVYKAYLKILHKNF